MKGGSQQTARNGEDTARAVERVRLGFKTFVLRYRKKVAHCAESARLGRFRACAAGALSMARAFE